MEDSGSDLSAASPEVRDAVRRLHAAAVRQERAKRLKRISVLALVLLALAGAAGVYLYAEDRTASRHDEEQGRRVRETAAVSRLLAFAKRAGATFEWERLIGGDALTAEVERVWLGGARRILFLGHVWDVSSVDEKNYLLQLDHAAPRRSAGSLKSRELRLDVVCPKERIQPVLSALSQGPRYRSWQSGVAVVTQIQRIRTERVPEPDVGDRVVLTATGSCADVLYVERVGDLRHR